MFILVRLCNNIFWKEVRAIRKNQKKPGFKNFLANTVFGNIEGNHYEKKVDEKKNSSSPIYIPKNSNTDQHKNK